MSLTLVDLSTPLGHAHLSHLPQRPPINLSFQDLTYTVQTGKSSKIILRSINGDFRSGQLTAILGPSGAGKSTLLNILAGYRVTGATGVISTNGEPRDLKQFRKLSRYIMQEDLLQPYLTVKEAMFIAADLKLGTDLSKAKKIVVVEEIIQLLRLTKPRNTATEKLSGGERKRLSIALELLNNPPVIFLDEPTTGLDDVASSTCVSLLKRVARGGRTVICSLHTPSARLFAEFDHVYVVSGGRCAYQGTSAGVVPFLKELQLPCPMTYNPADFVIEVASGEYGSHDDKMVSAVDNGRNHRWRNYAVEESSVEEIEIEQLNTGGVENLNYKHGCTPYQQFIVLLKRMVIQKFRNKSYLWLRVGLHLFLGTLVATMFNNMGYDASKTIFNFGFCYSCIIVMLYIPMMPILLSFPSEVQLVKREYFNRWYGLKAYYAALVCSRTPATIFFSLIYLVITYPLTAQPMEIDRILMFSSTCILVALISESLGTAISSLLSVVNSMFLGPAMSVPLMLLAVYGIGFGEEHVPLVWKIARSCSYLRYGVEGLVAAVYGPPRKDLICPDDVDYCEYKNVTGLDDVASSTCVSLLKRVARGGRTVICSLHTPSARLFAEFDHVYVVSGGRCAYQGTSAGVVPFLKELQLPCPMTYNPADFVIEVASGEYGSHDDKMVSAVDNGRNHRWRNYAVEESSVEEIEIEQLNTGGVENLNYKHGCTPYQQFIVLLKRMVIQKFRNKSYLWLRVGLHLFLGTLVATMFNNMGYDASKTIFNFGFCYSCIIVMLYIPMMPILLSFPSEVQLVKREYFNRWYGLKAYYAALVCSRTPATIFFSLIYLVITYPLTAQPMEIDRILMFSSTCILVALISESLGTAISSLLSVVNSMFLGPAMSVPLMLLAVYGIGFGEEHVPLVWKIARSCSYLRYGVEGLVAAVYGPPRKDLICPDDVDYCEYKNVTYFVKLLGMAGVSFWQDFGILVAMLLAMNFTGFYLLRQRLSPNYAFRAIKLIGNFVKTKMSSVH